MFGTYATLLGTIPPAAAQTLFFLLAMRYLYKSITAEDTRLAALMCAVSSFGVLLFSLYAAVRSSSGMTGTVALAPRQIALQFVCGGALLAVSAVVGFRSEGERARLLKLVLQTPAVLLMAHTAFSVASAVF